MGLLVIRCRGLFPQRLGGLGAGSVRVVRGHYPLRVVQQHAAATRVRIADSDRHGPKNISVVRPTRSFIGARRLRHPRGDGGLRQRWPGREGRVPCMHGPGQSRQPRRCGRRRHHERRAADRRRRRLRRGRQRVRGKERAERRCAVSLGAKTIGGIRMPDAPVAPSAGQGTLEVITSRGGLLTLRAHPGFSFVAPSASLTVPHPSSHRACRIVRGLRRCI